MADIIPGHTIFRTLLQGEAGLNVAGAIPMILFPKAILSRLLISPAMANVGHEQLLQILGVFFLGTAVPLYKASADTPEGVALRRTAYAQLGAIEILLSTLLIAQIYTDAPNALRRDTTVGLVASMLGALAWRVYSTVVRPDYAGWVVTTSHYRGSD